MFRSHWEEAEDLTARLRIDDVDVHSGALRSGDDIASESGLASGLHRFEVVAQDDHGNVSLERMAFTVFDPADRHPWPIPEATEPQTIGHLAHNFQHYGGRPYFHPGVDIRTPAESPVHSAVAGRVTELRYYGARPLYFEVAIQDDRGFLWEYHHIAEDSVPDAVREAFEKGQRVPAGTYLGSVIRWRVHAYGDRYDHLHLNVLDPWKNYLNPLRFLIAPSDDVPPRVAGLYFCPNEGERAFEVVRGTPVVSGDVDLVLEAEDLFGGAPFQLGVHEIRYQLVRVDARGKVPMGEPVLFCRFDSLPGGFDRHDGINSVFKRRLQVEDELLETEGNYSRRRFLYVLTHAPAGLVADKDSYWDTDGFRPDGEPLYPNGRYEVAVLAKDIFGNETRREFPVIVKNGSDAQSK
ncbi:MAG: M23 family metallopeptidase [Planctomycetota bacterium]